MNAIPVMVNTSRAGAYTLTKHLTRSLAYTHKARCLDRAMHTVSQSDIYIMHRVSYREGKSPPTSQTKKDFDYYVCIYVCKNITVSPHSEVHLVCALFRINSEYALKCEMHLTMHEYSI